jgi:hypothetical protein
MIIKHIDSDEIARAKMNLIQWTALATRMNRAESLKQLSDLPRFKIIKKSSISEVAKLKKFLCNGWTTESLLKQNASSFEGEALNHSLVWAFPQAYYSVYAVTLAYFDASGFTNNKTHSNIIKKFGDELGDGNYPESISFYASGGIDRKRKFKNCQKTTLPSSLYQDNSNPVVVNSHIASLLDSTRQYDLKDRLKKQRHKTKSGKPKKKFTDEEYDKASSQEGYTSILSFLYRKRVKSNYHDIDSFLSSQIEADTIFASILSVVDCLHAVHEAYIIKAIGKKEYSTILDALPSKKSTEQARKRLLDIEHILS